MEPVNFLQIDLLQQPRSNATFKKSIFKSTSANVQVIVADPPWESILLAANHHQDTYNLISSEDMLALFRRLNTWFVPNAREQVGELYLWFTNDKFDLALECLNAAGYRWVGLNSWHKGRLDGQPMALSPFRGNTEFFLVGRKSLANDNLTMKTSRGFVAPPYSAEHSSKPLEFYTQFLPFSAESRGFTFGKPWSQVLKCDLFTRHSQEGFISIGNQYRGPRTIKAAPQVLALPPPPPPPLEKNAQDVFQFLAELEDISNQIKPLKKRCRDELPNLRDPGVLKGCAQAHPFFDIDLVTEDLALASMPKQFKPNLNTTSTTTAITSKIIVGALVDVNTGQKLHAAKVIKMIGDRALVEWTQKRRGFASQEWVTQDCIKGKGAQVPL
jgi:N6-adenosine-specific RNA methylase IME4